MLAAPYFNEGPVTVDNLAVIGLAAGTIPKQYGRVFGPIPIDGIELDPAIVEAGRDYFALDDPNINIIVGDGRYELNQLSDTYDVITLDAYKVPYIPWHLTTREFFQEVRAHLAADGVLAINVGRAPHDRRLVEAVVGHLKRGISIGIRRRCPRRAEHDPHCHRPAVQRRQSARQPRQL